MKTKEQIFNKIREIIEEVSLGVTKACDIKESDKLIDDLGLDSLDYAEVMLSCEEWVGVKIKEDTISWGNVSTVENLADIFVKE